MQTIIGVSKPSGAFRYHAFMRRLAYDRGFYGRTFATRDESRWPGYDRAYRAGQRARAAGRESLDSRRLRKECVAVVAAR